MKAEISTYFRTKRFAFIMSLLDKLTKGGKKIKILDIGGTEDYWNSMGLNLGNNIEIVLLNLYKIEVRGAGFSSIKGEACNLEGVADKSFDLVFSNSVIEHLFSIENQQKMANEVKRVGKNYYIQTPNKFFPIEPHWVFPFFQFLPFGLKVYLTKNFSLGHISKAKSKQEAIDLVNEVNLLSKKELESLFSESKLYIEKFIGFDKSYAVYKIEN
jgi:ubiquinone/menaquinone biosynthesis C-methylase UbiE